MLVFGPVPSRRLGRSLGINNIPPKVCSFSCLYCQAGRTSRLQVERAAFYQPEAIAAAVFEKVRILGEAGETVDYLSFVPNGEPTLDMHLGRTIDLLKPLGIRIAVITNASLLWREDVRRDLARADWVSVKVDSLREDAWRSVDRPHGKLGLSTVLDGVAAFADSYRGDLVTETLLVRDVNDSASDIKQLGRFIGSLKPLRAYLNLPLRPPAERRIAPPPENVVNRVFRMFCECGIDVELLAEYEGSNFSCAGSVADNIMSIAAVHPLREEAVRAMLADSGSDWSMVAGLLADGRLVETEYNGSRFYLRSFAADHNRKVQGGR